MRDGQWFLGRDTMNRLNLATPILVIAGIISRRGNHRIPLTRSMEQEPNFICQWGFTMFCWTVAPVAKVKAHE
jgi:hypothetical protein